MRKKPASTSTTSHEVKPASAASRATVDSRRTVPRAAEGCSAMAAGKQCTTLQPYIIRSMSSPGAVNSSATASSATTTTRSEEHTSELQSLMRISYAVFCLKKKTSHNTIFIHSNTLISKLTTTTTHSP